MDKELRLLSLSNYVPEEIFDILRFKNFRGSVKISNFCTYVQNFMSQVMIDASFDGAIIPNSCDSIRIAKDYISSYSDKFVYQIKHPLHITPEAVILYSKEIQNYKIAIENHFKITISENSINERINFLDEKYNYIKKLYDSLEELSYFKYITAVNSSFDISLCKWNDAFHEKDFTPGNSVQNTPNKNRVFLVGPFLSDLSVIELIESLGGKIIGDDLTNSKRYFSLGALHLHMPHENIFEKIACRNLSKHPSPTLNNYREIINSDIVEIKLKKVDKVIFIYQKFCEPHEYIYPIFKEELEREGIKVLRVHIENEVNQGNKLRLSLETFLNI